MCLSNKRSGVNANVNANESRCKRSPNKTITVAACGENEEMPISVKQLRDALGIETRHTINEHLKALGLFGKQFLTWDEAKHVIGCYQWVQIKHGNRKFSKQKYAALRRQNLAEQALQRLGKIDLQTELERIKSYVRHQHSATN